MINANVANDALTVMLIDKSPEWIDTEWCVWCSYGLEKLCRSCSWVTECSCSVLHRLLVGASAGLSQDLSPLCLHVACRSLTLMTGFPPKNVHQIRALATEWLPRGGLNQISHRNKWWQLVTELFFSPCLMLNVIPMFQLSCFVLETLLSHRIIHYHVIPKPFLAFGGSSSIIVFSRVLCHRVAAQTLGKNNHCWKILLLHKEAAIQHFF